MFGKVFEVKNFVFSTFASENVMRSARPHRRGSKLLRDGPTRKKNTPTSMILIPGDKKRHAASSTQTLDRFQEWTE